jgi:hypothetical protein
MEGDLAVVVRKKGKVDGCFGTHTNEDLEGQQMRVHYAANGKREAHRERKTWAGAMRRTFRAEKLRCDAAGGTSRSRLEARASETWELKMLGKTQKVGRLRAARLSGLSRIHCHLHLSRCGRQKGGSDAFP